MRDRKNFDKVLDRIERRLHSMPRTFSDVALADVAEEAVVRALVETLEAPAAEIPFQPEDCPRVQTIELVECQFDLMAPRLMEMLTQLPKRDDIYRFRFRVLPLPLFFAPREDGEASDMQADELDETFKQLGMRRPTLEEAIVALVMVSHRFGDFLPHMYHKLRKSVYALLMDSEKLLRMSPTQDRLVLEIDSTGRLCSDYCCIGVLLEK